MFEVTAFIELSDSFFEIIIGCFSFIFHLSSMLTDDEELMVELDNGKSLLGILAKASLEIG